MSTGSEPVTTTADGGVEAALLRRLAAVLDEHAERAARRREHGVSEFAAQLAASYRTEALQLGQAGEGTQPADEAYVALFLALGEVRQQWEAWQGAGFLVRLNADPQWMRKALERIVEAYRRIPA